LGCRSVRDRDHDRRLLHISLGIRRRSTGRSPSALKRRRPDARGIILTGYGNIATAVNAVKLGAVDYLAKPVNTEQLLSALRSWLHR